MTGPEVVVYRVGPRLRASLDSMGPLPTSWWTEAIPARLRTQPGVLADVYAARIEPFVSQLAIECALLGRNECSASLAAATLATRPNDLDASALLAAASARLGRWGTAREVSERVLALHLEPDVSASFELLRARSVLHEGRAEEATRALEKLAASRGRDDAVGLQASQLLDSLRVVRQRRS
jgi:hypothetical protein